MTKTRIIASITPCIGYLDIIKYHTKKFFKKNKDMTKAYSIEAMLDQIMELVNKQNKELAKESKYLYTWDISSEYTYNFVEDTCKICIYTKSNKIKE